MRIPLPTALNLMIIENLACLVGWFLPLECRGDGRGMYDLPCWPPWPGRARWWGRGSRGLGHPACSSPRESDFWCHACVSHGETGTKSKVQ